MTNLKLMQPQEIEVFYILPAIRHEIAKVLKEQGLKQKEIAKLLFVKESTISQYLNDKRAKEIIFNDKIKEYISRCASKIKNKENMVMITQSILKLVRMENVLCDIHRRYGNVSKNCTQEKTGCC